MQMTETPAMREIQAQIGNALRRGRLPHAIILEGGGADMLAKWVSAAAVCTGAGEKPCGCCLNCRKAMQGIHPDIHIASGRGAARSFHVEEIRFIRTDVYQKPNEAMMKVYLLLGAQDMSREAQNALLKILEEPPQALFVLTCDNVKSLLPTVCSRAQIFSLPQEDNPPDTETALQAESIAAQILEAVLSPKEWDLLAVSAPLIADKALFRRVLGELSSLLRDICVYRTCGERAGARQDLAETLSGTLTLGRLLRMSALTEETRQRASQNANHALLVTAFFAAL